MRSLSQDGRCYEGRRNDIRLHNAAYEALQSAVISHNISAKSGNVHTFIMMESYNVRWSETLAPALKWSMTARTQRDLFEEPASWSLDYLFLLTLASHLPDTDG